ncbi:MAG: AbrB/MazE/SpoVT family DNA-binding domain-containing protein [Candidatus Woesearchaeota archaeon]
MEIAITTVSSKGQIVLPKEIRGNIKSGDKLVFIKDNNNIMIKNTKDLSKNFEEDLLIAERTELAWKEYEQGKFTTMSKDGFIDELEKW